MNNLEIRILMEAQEPDGAWFCFTTPDYEAAVKLLDKGLLRRLPRNVSPFHDGFKTTRAGKRILLVSLPDRGQPSSKGGQ